MRSAVPAAVALTLLACAQAAAADPPPDPPPPVVPTIASLAPSVGVAGSTFTIAGAGFTGTTSVTVGGVSATFTAGSDTSISATVPTGAASGFVAVTNPAGTATSTAPFLVLPAGSFAHVFTVNSAGDSGDATAGDGSCNDGSGNCTLRAAIQEANAASGSDLIAFAIAASGQQTITPASTLPAITDPVTVDGTTEPGFSGQPLVVLNGDAAGTSDGLAVSAGSTTVRGLVVTRFAGWQIHLTGAGGDVVAGNFIGTTPDGTNLGTPAGRASSGVFVDNVPGATIGGTTGTSGAACTGDCNLISLGYPASGAGEGIRIAGAASTGTVVAGDFIGTSRTGGALPGGAGVNSGIFVSQASNTTIGGATAAARNLISNAAFYGVRLDHANSTHIQGNWFGLDASGANALPTTQNNIYDDGSSPGTVIGGLTSTPGTAPGNVISGSLSPGMQVGSTGAVVQGNLIGTNASGTGAAGNGDGIDVIGPVTIGGSDPQARNVISGNRDLGVYVIVGGATIQGNDIGTSISGSAALGNSVGVQVGSQFSGPVSNVTVTGNVVSGQALHAGTYLTSADGIVLNGGGVNDAIVANLIGVAADGSSPLGNAGNGVNAISVGLGTVVGGTASSAWNTIAGNGAAGVKGGNAGVVVLGNSIHDNGGLGIDNALSSANGQLTIGHVVSSGNSSTVSGSLTSVFAGSPYLVQLYVSPTCDPSGSGEGQTFAGSFTLTPAAAGTATFSQTVPVSISAGQSLSGTVTIGNVTQGNIDTGQFSHCKVTGTADLMLAENVSPSPVDQGSKLTLTYTVTNLGPDAAPGTSFSATYPSNATFAGVTTTAGTCSGVKGSATCALGTLANGQAATITVVLFPVVAGTFGSTGSVSSSVDDLVSGNDTTSVPVVVHAAAFTPASFVVNSTGDGHDSDVADLVCNDGTNQCTLRAALEQANIAPGTNPISFALLGSGVQTIAPASALPPITDPVVLDATTQPGYAGQPLVELNGAATPLTTDGLVVSAGDSTVSGFVVDDFRGWQIHLLANGGDTISGNYIGTTPDGLAIAGTPGQPYSGIFVDGVANTTIGGTAGTSSGACTGDCNLISPGFNAVNSGLAIQISGAGATGTGVFGNFVGTDRLGHGFANVGATSGVFVSQASGTTIGGTTAAARNLFANLAFYGVRLDHATGTKVEGDWFGVDASGANALSITGGAVYDDGSSPGTQIGGLTSVPGTAPGNVIGTILNSAMQVQTTGTLVQGNLIGTDATGTVALGHNDGIDVLGAVTIGGSDLRARNVISGNELGLYVLGAGATIRGNYIGTDITGNEPLPNSIGIQLGSSSFTSGPAFVTGTTITGNVISGQALRPGSTFTHADGIVTDAGTNQTTITGNLIGVAANGVAPLPNAGDGIHAVRGGLDVVGSTTAGGDNTIAGNGGAGVHVELGVALVYGNSIHDNGGLGISSPASLANGQLSLDGVVTSGGGSTVNATISNSFQGTATVQLYRNASCDPSGAGEGQTFLGAFPVTIDSSGNGTLAAPVAAIPAGTAVTGTLTISNPSQGDVTTSEFTSCAITGSADLGVTGSAAPAPVDPGHKLTLTFHVTNHGPDASAAPGLTLTFPSDATFVSAVASSGSCSGVRGHATCSFAALASGATATATVVLYPLTPGAASASASITSSQSDGNAANNSVTVPFTITSAPFTPESYVVNSTGDGHDADLGDLSCDDGTGACTLRAAIEQANAAPGTNPISFAIPGSGVQTITPASALPNVTDPVVLDATTQPGYAGTPLVLISGASLPDKTDGLVIDAGNTAVRGLAIDYVRGWSIHLLGNGGNTIAANYIGATPDGLDVGETPGQRSNGIFVDGVPGNTIGGTTGTSSGSCTGDCNLISPGYMFSGTGLGVQISGAGATGNVVEGNFVGTDRLGHALPHGYSGAVTGVSVSQAGSTTIGGTTAAARNLFANIAFYGVRLDHASNTTIQGNWFGVDASGANALPITAGGVYDDGSSPGTVIGGLTSVPGTAPGNVIGAILNSEIQVQTTGTLVQGNLIGTDATGTVALGRSDGIDVLGTVTIGGSDPRARNVISGNDLGLYVLGAGATIQGNYIGTDITGNVPLPNSIGVQLGSVSFSTGTAFITGTTITGNVISGQALRPGSTFARANGIVVDGGTDQTTITGNVIGLTANGLGALPNAGDGVDAVRGGFVTIGGTGAGAGNTIAGNGGAGVHSEHGAALILGNSIHDNGGLGIQSDIPVPDASLTISSADASGSGTEIVGSATVLPSTLYRIELFKSASCDPSGAGEGATFLGAISGTAAGATVSFDQVFPAVFSGEVVTGTLSIGNSIQGLFGTTGFTTCVSPAHGVAQAPTITAPPDVTVGTGPGATCACAVVSDAALGTATASAGATVTRSGVPSGNVFPLGTTTVTWTATSPGGEASATQHVTVKDTTPPLITAPASITTSPDPGLSTATVDPGTATATDNSGSVTVSGTRSDGPFALSAPYPTGTTTITWTATDGAGNTATVTQTITVQDTEPPVVHPPADVTVSTDPGLATATVNPGTATATDNSGSATVSGSRSDCPCALTDPYPIGTTTITWTAKDAFGNTASATQNVTVHDTERPVVHAPADVTVSTDPGLATATVNPGLATATDNSGSVTVSGSRSDCPCALTDPYRIGTTTITWTATDAAGNTAIATQTVTVRDMEPPVIHAPADVSVSTDPGLATATVNVGNPVVSDNGGSVAVSSSRSDGAALNAPFPLGTTTITWTAKDAFGNTATATQTVTVNDTEVPVIHAPADVTAPTDPGLATATVDPGTAAATDNSGGSVSITGLRVDCPCSLTDPYQIGTTTITWTATDAAGNTATATQTVTVVDKEPPVVTPPANIVTTAQAGQVSVGVKYDPGTATDNVPGVGRPTCTPPPGSSFPLGTTTVTCSATDRAGNVGSATFTVFVNTPPVVDSVTIDQSSPGTNDTLTATVLAHDANGDALTYAYSWLKNGVAIAGETGPTLDLSQAGNGDRDASIALEVTANDGLADSFAVQSAAVTVADTAPVVDSAVISPLSPGTNAVLSVTVTSHDVDGDTITYGYQWSKNGNPIAGATGATLDLSQPGNGDAGDAIAVTVTPSDGTLAGAALTSASVTVTGGAPPVLHLSAASAAVQYSDALAPIAVTATGDHITFGATGLPAGVSLTPSGTGATIAGTVTAPAGTYAATVTASDGTTTVTSPLTITVTKEDSTVTYTGDSFFATPGATGTVTLAATVKQAADGKPGDLTKAQVEFRLFRSSNSSSTPDAVVGPVAVSAAGAATATATLAQDTWTVVARVVPANTWFTSPSSDAAAITVFKFQPFAFAAGAGFVRDPATNGPDEFVFEVHNDRSSTSGGFRYEFRGSDGLEYVVRSSSVQGLTLSGHDQRTASFGGRATVTAFNPRGHRIVPSAGGTGFSFRVDATDNGRDHEHEHGHDRDRFALVVTRPDGTVFHRAGTPAAPLTLAGGNIHVDSHH